MHKLLLAILIAALALPALSPAQEAVPAEKPSLKLADPLKESASPGESTLNDQTDVAITAYNTNGVHFSKKAGRQSKMRRRTAQDLIPLAERRFKRVERDRSNNC